VIEDRVHTLLRLSIGTLPCQELLEFLIRLSPSRNLRVIPLEAMLYGQICGKKLNFIPGRHVLDGAMLSRPLSFPLLLFLLFRGQHFGDGEGVGQHDVQAFLSQLLESQLEGGFAVFALLDFLLTQHQLLGLLELALHLEEKGFFLEGVFGGGGWCD